METVKLNDYEINAKREVARDISEEIAYKIKTLYDFMNDNFEECFDFQNLDQEFPIYDFELRMHHDTYSKLSERLQKPYGGG